MIHNSRKLNNIRVYISHDTFSRNFSQRKEEHSDRIKVDEETLEGENQKICCVDKLEGVAKKFTFVKGERYAFDFTKNHLRLNLSHD